jgi:fructose-1,6-bisphosphatase II
MHEQQFPPELDRNLGLDLVRATEAAALAAGTWMGFGEVARPDRAARTAMEATLNTFPMDGVIAIGERPRTGHDNIPLPLQRGTPVGTGSGAVVDVIADAADGLNLLADGQRGVMSVAAVAPRGMLWAPVGTNYMEKLIVNEEVAAALVPECLDAPVGWTLALIARAKGVPVRRLVIFVLDRPRHRPLVDEIRRSGARVELRRDGDVAGALQAAATGYIVDALMGIGGVAEGVMAACAVKALGGAIIGRLAPQSAAERRTLQEAGHDPDRILTTNDIVPSDDFFFSATGITDGALLHGLRFNRDRAITESLILRGRTRTFRRIQSEHPAASP